MSEQRKFLTNPDKFTDVSRGNPVPHKLTGEALRKARLTADTWRLEIESEGTAKIDHPKKLDAGTAIDLPALLSLGAKHGVKFLKAMQCNNIAQPLGQGLWEGVPLRNVLRTTGNMRDVRRVYYWGFHNNDPKQMFQSSLAINQVLDTPPGELPPFIAYRLNGQPIPLERGGPVRMLIPWAHGFKSVKWLQHITLTNDYKANDTYALQNNDPESYLKTAAYIDSPEPGSYQRGRPITLRGHGHGRLAGPRTSGILAQARGRHSRPHRRRRSRLEDGRVAALRNRSAAIGLGRWPSRRRQAQRRSGASAPTANPRNGRCVSASHSGQSASKT